MPKILKYLAIAIAALLVVLVAAIGILAATFDPNDYKPQLIRMVQEKTQRTLTIPGQIGLSFFPKLGVDLGQVRLSEHRSNEEFASVQRAKLAFALVPLLSRRLVVDRIQVDGMRAQIRRDKDGRSNYEDLLPKEKSGEAAGKGDDGGGQLVFDIDSVAVNDAQLVYDDRQQDRMLNIANLNLETGKIANGVPSRLQLAADVKSNKPEVNARVAAKSGFTMDLVQQRYALKGLDAEVRGSVAGMNDLLLKLAGDADVAPETKRFILDGIRVSASGKQGTQVIDARFEVPKLSVTDTQVTGGKLSGDAKITEGARNISARFSTPSFEGSPQAFRLPSMELDAIIREDKLDATLKLAGALAGDIDKLLFNSPQLALTLAGKQGETPLNGSLTTPLSVNWQTQVIDLPKIAADFRLPNPGGGALALNANGRAGIDLGKKKVSATLAGKLDQSSFNATLGAADFSPMRYTFDIGIDRLDLDRYKAKPAAASAQKAPSKEQAKEQPMDFSALQKLQATGSVRVGALKLANINTSNLRVNLRAADGKLDVNPLTANLYGGSTSGALTLTASKPARFAVRQNLNGIQVGPLLKDAIGKDPIEGKGNVQLDVVATGATFEQIKKTLDGSARLELRDGAIRGINIAQAVRSAKSKLAALKGAGEQQAQSGTGSTGEKTDFSELTGSFRITNGVAHNDDLQIKSPLVRIAGSGAIDIGSDRLDYLARTTVVSTLQGQGGPELQELKGVTVPVRLSGPFNAIGWRVDVAGMASELAKQKLDERKGELKEKAQKSLDEQKAKARDQLKDQLKGLFGK